MKELEENNVGEMSDKEFDKFLQEERKRDKDSFDMWDVKHDLKVKMGFVETVKSYGENFRWLAVKDGWKDEVTGITWCHFYDVYGGEIVYSAKKTTDILKELKRKFPKKKEWEQAAIHGLVNVMTRSLHWPEKVGWALVSKDKAVPVLLKGSSGIYFGREISIKNKKSTTWSLAVGVIR